MEVTHVPVPPDEFLENAISIGGADLYWVRAPAFAARCVPQQSEGVIKLVAATEGSLEFQQGDNQTRLSAGMFTWIDVDEPFELRASAGRQLQLRFPVQLLRSRHPELDIRTGVARGHDHPGERIVAGLLTQLSREGRWLSANACSVALHTVLEALALGPTRTIDVASERRIAFARRDVEQHLAEPGLQPTDVAARQGVSRRYLDGLFREHVGTTLAQYIRQQRLEYAARVLGGGLTVLTSDVAFRCGFRDVSHFSRVFRKHFGQTPTAYRQLACRNTVEGPHRR